MSSTVRTSAYCRVMFRLDLSARPTTVSKNMPADCGDRSPLIFALLCLHLLPHAIISLSLSLSPPIFSDAA